MKKVLKEKVDQCKGCPTNGFYCRNFNQDGECPCTNCVVKAMCDEACDERKKWDYMLIELRSKFKEIRSV